MRENWLDGGLPGVGRLGYFLGKVGIVAGVVFAVNLLGAGSSWVRVIGLAASFVSFGLDVMRLRCIGLSRWWAMLRFVPYVNLFYWIFLQSAQAGWAETRRLDRTGRTLMIFQLVLLGMLIFMLMRMRVAVPYFL